MVYYRTVLYDDYTDVASVYLTLTLVSHAVVGHNSSNTNAVFGRKWANKNIV